MGDIITIQNCQSDIIQVQDYPIQITISQAGIRGPSGAPGTGGGGFFPISGFAGVSYLNNLSGNLSLIGAGGVTVTSNGVDTIQISGNNSAVINLSGINNIAVSQSGQVYFISGVNLINTSQTGQFYSANNPQFYIKSGEVITISGILQTNINNQINSLSGFNNNTFATIFNLQNTGQNNYINSTNNAINLSGNLQSTGSFLLGLINASSAGVSSLNSQSGAISFTGAGNTNVIVNGQNFIISGNTGFLAEYATAINLAATGTNLQNQINNVTVSNVVYTTGNQSIVGIKTFTTGIVISYISGGANYFGGLLDSNGVSSVDWITRSLVDSAGVQCLTYDIRVLRDTIQNYSIEWGNRFLRDAAQNYVLDWNNKILSGDWTKNGNYILTIIDSGNIQSEINSIQNQPVVTGISINGSTQHLTGYVTFSAGNNDISLGQNATSIVISAPGIQQTGSILDNKINSLSGYSNLTFSTITNLQATGQNLQNQINNITVNNVVYTTGDQIVNGQKDFTNNAFFEKTGWFNNNTAAEGDKQFNEVIKIGRYYSTESQDINGFLNAPSHGIGFYRDWMGTTTGVLAGIYTYPGQNWAGGLTFLTNRTAIGPAGPLQISMTLQADGSLRIGSGVAAAKLDVDGNIMGSGFYSGIINLGDIFYSKNNPSGFITSTNGGGVSSINTLTGALGLTGAGGITILTSGKTFVISGSGLPNAPTLPFDFGYVNITSGNFNSQFIPFHQNFANSPSVYGNLINSNGDGLISYSISGINTSGFYLNFSDLINTNNYYFDYIATTGLGVFSFAFSSLVNNQTNNVVNNISGGSITGAGTVGYIPQFTKDGSGIVNSVISGNSTGVYITNSLTVSGITVPNANFRIKDGQMQFFDLVAWSGDPTRPWRALGVNNGSTIWSNPILD